MNKKILNSANSKTAAALAIKQIAGIVKQTLGPNGNPIVIQRDGRNPDGTELGPLITKDGVTVAEHTSLREPALNTFIQTIVQVAQNTVKEGGDGTTTSIILAEAIFNEGFTCESELKESMDIAAEEEKKRGMVPGTLTDGVKAPETKEEWAKVKKRCDKKKTDQQRSRRK
jgi:chaperonin GroEL